MSDVALDSVAAKALDKISDSAWNDYSEYKDSGVFWLGSIPEHWKSKRLKYAVRLVNENVESIDTDLPYLGLENIESWTGRKVETEGQAEGVANHFSNGDVLFGKLRPYLAKVYHAKVEGLCTGEALVLRQKEMVPQYLFFYLLSKDFINIVDSSTYGAKMPRANWDFIGNLPALLPDVEEQQAIATFLDRETARIDALIAKKLQLIELLQENRTALISQAVTKGLDTGVPMKDSGVEWLGEIPAHWGKKRLKFLFDCHGGGTPNKANIEYWNGSIPWVSPKDMKGHTVSDTEDHITEQAVVESATQLVEPGAVLLVVRSGILRHTLPVAINTVQVALNQDMKALQANGVLKSPYLKYFVQGLNRALLDSWSKMGCTVESIETDLMRNSLLPVVSEYEQEAICSFLDRETSRIDSVSYKVQEAVAKLTEYRTALITAAVTGKIDVRELDR